MLGRVVAMEQKELELQRQQLIIEDAENQSQLKDIEEKILQLLKSAEGNILDDEVLIDTLADSKKTSRVIQEKVKVAELTQNRIAKVRQGYLPVAFRAAQLFFCIADLAGVDPMYQYSLDWYISLYESANEQAEKSKVLEERLRNLSDCFTYLLYKNVCRSLFEKDKLLFSFLLTTKIMSGHRTLDPAELRFFLQVCILCSVAPMHVQRIYKSHKYTSTHAISSYAPERAHVHNTHALSLSLCSNLFVCLINLIISLLL